MADWSVLKILLVAGHLFSLGLAFDPCYNYKLLTDDGGRSIKCTKYYPYSHDRFINEGWRRVQLESTREDLTMPTQFVPDGRCGSHSNVWLNGTHPTVEDGIVDRIGCLSMFSSDCYTKYPIQIKNCKGYMVYNLKRTLGSAERYCFGNSVHCDPKTTTAPPSTTRSTGNFYGRRFRDDYGQQTPGYKSREIKRTSFGKQGRLGSSKPTQQKTTDANKRKIKISKSKKREKNLAKKREKLENVKGVIETLGKRIRNLKSQVNVLRGKRVPPASKLAKKQKRLKELRGELSNLQMREKLLLGAIQLLEQE